MTIQDQLSDLIHAALTAAQGAGALPAFDLPAEIPIQRPKAGYGDFASPVAMALARFAKQPPLAVAQTVAAHLPTGGLVGKVEVAPPGFINLWLSANWMAAQVERILQAGPSFGDATYGQGQRAQVEFVSANPTGPLTIGHGRNAVLGDSLARLLEAVGYQVTREYYYNDAGRQMELLGESVRARYRQLLGQTVEWSEDYYQGEDIIEIARELQAEFGDTLADEPLDRFRRFAQEVITETQQAALTRLGIRFDVLFNEHNLTTSGEVWEVVKGLKEAGVAYDAEGATWIRMTQFGGEKDRVLVRSNGEPTYSLPDIAYHKNKFDRGFDLMVNVLGADHAAQYPIVAAALKTLGYDTSKLHVVSYQFVTLLRDGQVVRMSKRKANYVTLNELIDEVGPDVVRYFLLMRSVDTHIEFDLNLAVKQSDDNPVYYVQYAHTRIAGVLRQAAERGIELDPQADVSVLSDPSEMALIREMLRLEEVVTLAAKQLAPHHLCFYATDLATAFHTFYDRCPVLPPKQTDAALTQARLKLCAAAQQTLARTLGLLGVTAPDRM
ncbi:MAG: arginine--tRNA ligase [Anaerolineae bacterium]|nr:arginine--tRNA ligase [Anaerolineae bacterium]